MNKLEFKNLKYLFPEKTEINNKGILEINKNDLSDLVKKYGSPLYIYDENTTFVVVHGLKSIEGANGRYHCLCLTLSLIICFICVCRFLLLAIRCCVDLRC